MRAAVVISSGFAEERGEAAQERDRALREVIERFGIVVCGPNSEGLVNPLKPLVATFSPVFHDPTQSLFPESRKSRAIAVSCQSGALTFAFLSRGRPRQLRFTYQASAGNQICLEAHDYVDWLLDSGGADIFLAYLEGIRDPTGSAPSPTRPPPPASLIIIAKVGRSEAGRRAAASHTGSLGPFRRHRRCDLPPSRHHPRRGSRPHGRHGRRLRLLQTAARQPRRGDHRLRRQCGVDVRYPVGARAPNCRCSRRDCSSALMALLPSYASAQNPVDGTAQAIHEVGYAKLVEIVRESQRIDTILLIGSLANEATAKQRAEELAAVTGDTEQPILLSTYTTATPGAMAAFAEAGIPCYTSMPSCARAIRALVDYARFQRAAARSATGRRNPARPTRRGRPRTRRRRPGADRGRSQGIARALRRPSALRRRSVTSADEAAAAAARIGGPVALKVQSPDITHKTEAGAVALASAANGAVREAYQRIIAKRHRSPTRTQQSTASWCRQWRRLARK